jgi:hypothetical protein
MEFHFISTDPEKIQALENALKSTVLRARVIMAA